MIYSKRKCTYIYVCTCMHAHVCKVCVCGGGGEMVVKW